MGLTEGLLKNSHVPAEVKFVCMSTKELHI